MSIRKILDVGQCDYDHGNIERLLRTHFQVEVDRAHTAAETLERIGRFRYDLILVNRVLDHDGSSGLELLRQLKSGGAHSQLHVMLVTNYEDIQEEAVALGSLPGFGKSGLGDVRTLERLRAALEA